MANEDAKLTHLDAAGSANMVDVSEKSVTHRIAVARGTVTMRTETLDLIRSGNAKKGDVIGTARIAGILAAKKTHVTNRIRELRFHAGEMTQQELAERIGVSRQTVVAIEKARYSPTLELAFRIAAVFDVPLDAVFAYEPD